MNHRSSHRLTSLFILIAVSILILFFHSNAVLSAQMTLAWDPNTEADLAGYKVYFGTGSRTYGSPIDVGNVTTYTLVGLTPGQNYFYSVTARDTSGRESEYSNEVNGVAREPTQAYTVTTNPTGLQITVDGASYTAPRAFSWVVGSTHTVSVSTPQAAGSGARYVHSSWSDGGGQSHTVTVPSSSTTYTASFSTEYSLTTSVQQAVAGAVTPSGTNWYNSGQVVSVLATANQGYSFSYWTGDLSGATNPPSITMNGNKTVTANFTKNSYTLALTVNPAGSGSVVKNPDKATYGYGDVVQLTAAANPGYSFSNWSGDASASTNPISITINGNKSVTANFTANSYTLALNVNPAGSGSVVKNPDKATYGYGDVVQLTAAANSGYSFSNLSGDAGGSTNPVSITIDGNKTVTANFTFVAGFLSVTPSEGFISSGNIGGTFAPSGQTFTLQNTGQNEINWNASKGHRWVSLSHSNGSLLPGASTNVVVSINKSARGLLAGTHTDIITFSNVTNGNGDTPVLAVLKVSEIFNSNSDPITDPIMDTVSVEGSWVFEISGMDKGGAALWFMNNALYGYGISINNGMFEIEGSYDIDSKGSINGTYTLYDFESLLELGSGNITGKAGKKVTKLNFEINTVNEEPLFIKMKGGRFIEEPVIPTGGMAKITGSRKGTLFPLKIEPSKFDGDIYPHVFKVSGPGIILEIGQTEMEGYFFLTQKKKIYGIYQFGGVEPELGVFSGKWSPASGIYNLKVMNGE